MAILSPVWVALAGKFGVGGDVEKLIDAVKIFLVLLGSVIAGVAAANIGTPLNSGRGAAGLLLVRIVFVA